MMDKKDKNFVVQKIRTQYMEQESTELDALKELDATVKRPANAFAYAFGIVGSLVMGAGMSLAMNVIEPGSYMGISIGENMMIPGVIIGVIGMGMMLVNYPIYSKLLNSRKQKYAAQILELSDKIMD